MRSNLARGSLDSLLGLVRAGLVSGLGRFRKDLPPVYWTLALFYLCGGLLRLLLVVFPFSPRAPTHLNLAIGIIFCVLAGLIWWLGQRIHLRLLRAQIVVAPIVVSLMVAEAHRPAGALMLAFAYPWMIVFTAHFFSRRVAFVQATLITLGFGLGLLVDGLGHMAPEWAIVATTVWAAAIVQGNLSRSLRGLADTDQLTGVLNRNGLRSAAARERAIAARSGAPLTVVMIDLDGFKEVNDRYGHDGGDRLLEGLGRAWREHLRPGDTLARYGGDEFVLLLPATSCADAERVLGRLRIPSLQVSWSAGMSEWLPAEDLQACISRADGSLYTAKQSLYAAEQSPGELREPAYPDGSLLRSA